MSAETPSEEETPPEEGTGAALRAVYEEVTYLDTVTTRNRLVDNLERQEAAWRDS